jgi:magnesium-transporting ATPase (P-type)
VHSFLQPRTLKLAGIAALATAFACYPRLSLWSNRSAPVWYLEAIIFFGGIVLWGFVFAWHTPYTHRPVFTLKIESGPFITATLAGIMVAIVFHLFLDPSLRHPMPEDYPVDLKQWFAMTLFSLAFSQMFLIFAPFAWLIRLFHNRRVATGLTVLFGVVVLVFKTGSSPTPIPPPLFAALLAGRIFTGFLAVWFYLRGGMILIWWWTFLFEARNLLDLPGSL